MSACVICKVNLIGQCLICKSCFDAWPRGASFGDYCKMLYKPEPVKYPAGHSVCEDAP